MSDENKKEIKVVSVMSDKTKTIFYLQDGNQITLKNGDDRIKPLLDLIIPITSKGEVAIVSLQSFSVYSSIEHQSGGVTKFFRMAKDKVNGFFGNRKNHIPSDLSYEAKQEIIAKLETQYTTLEDVAEHGTAMIQNDEHTEDETVVAVVTIPATKTEPEKKVAIPGIEKIKPLMNNAIKNNSPSMKAFLIRCASFIEKRQHSVEDLIRFLEKGDLPLANDGSIIAYKMLNYAVKDNPAKDTFVDCHSGNIRQKVGSYVTVNENLVDLSRRNECSNGLHIARRSYLSTFRGDVCVLCKIDPEDVMVVPHNDANKVRVKGYHILAVLTDEATRFLKANKPMTTDVDALKDVYKAIEGNHVPRLEIVKINGQMGLNVVITPINQLKGITKNENSSNKAIRDINKAAALDDTVNSVDVINLKEINKKVIKEVKKNSKKKSSIASSGSSKKQTLAKEEPKKTSNKQKTTKPASVLVSKPQNVKAKIPPLAKTTISSVTKNSPTKTEEARILFKTGKFDDLQRLKKKLKKSWVSLGFSEVEVNKIEKAK